MRTLPRRISPPRVALLLGLLLLGGCLTPRGLRNAPDDLALAGYDPVAYFPEGGGEPLPGDPDITATHDGLEIRFTSVEHRQRFEADPERYLPAYGGWCAYAMVDGERVEVNPRSFLVQQGRLLLFYDGAFGDTRAQWLEGDTADQERRADAAWRELVAGQESDAPDTGP